jgi:hypothetical protein
LGNLPRNGIRYCLTIAKSLPELPHGRGESLQMEDSFGFFQVLKAARETDGHAALRPWDRIATIRNHHRRQGGTRFCFTGSAQTAVLALKWLSAP